MIDFTAWSFGRNLRGDFGGSRKHEAGQDQAMNAAAAGGLGGQGILAYLPSFRWMAAFEHNTAQTEKVTHGESRSKQLTQHNTTHGRALPAGPLNGETTASTHRNVPRISQQGDHRRVKATNERMKRMKRTNKRTTFRRTSESLREDQSVGSTMEHLLSRSLHWR